MGENRQQSPPCAACPVLADAARISDLAQDIRRTMRKLRRDLDHCKTCPAGEGCPILQDYQAQVSRAIAEVLAELAVSKKPIANR